jgi:hypothetical protein
MEEDNSFITNNDLEDYKDFNPEIPNEVKTDSELIIDGYYFPWLVN